MGSCLSRDEKLNMNLTNLNDSRHVMMSRTSSNYSLDGEDKQPEIQGTYKRREKRVIVEDDTAEVETEKMSEDVPTL